MKNLSRFLAFSLGVVLSLLGFHIFTWQFWVLQTFVIIYGLVTYAEGRADEQDREEEP